MAFTSTPSDFSPSSIKKLDPAKYTSLSDYINEVNAPDNRESLVKTYGNQGITGFLQMVGAVKASGTADEITYWEEARLHARQAYTLASAVTGAKSVTLTFGAGNAPVVRVNDVVLLNGDERGVVTAVTGTTSFTVANLADAAFTDGAGSSLAAASHTIAIVGNLYGQGTDQPSEYLESNVVKRTNPYMILKEKFQVTGSQATNIGWINLGNGDYRWYVKSEADTRQRFIDKREMMMLLGERISNSAVTGFGDGSEGYFSAIEDRGIVNNGTISVMDDLDALIVLLDKQGAPAEYAVYVDRAQDLAFDDLIASGIGSGLTTGIPGQFGTFNNNRDMAVTLGFASLMRGSYTFHKHSWKLLNEPTLLGNGVAGYGGVMIPVTKVVDARSGEKAPSLEMNYKATNGYSREMEHWMTGSILGVTNTNTDNIQFNYRSEFNLVTRAANQHVLLKKA